MNKDVLNQFVTEMLTILQDAKAFAAAELPELFKEIVAYGVWSNGIYIAIGVVLLITGVICTRKALKLKSHDEMDEQMAFAITALVSLVIGIVSVAANISSFIQATVAPRLYLIEYFKELM